MDVDDRLKKFVFSKLNSDLKNSVFFPCGRELWILDIDDKRWFFQSDCTGQVYYNSKFFNQFFRLFNLKQDEYQVYLKEWYENLTIQKLRCISRRNADGQYIVESLLRNRKDDWTIFERYEWSYPIVKRYLDMKKSLKSKFIKLGDII